MRMIVTMTTLEEIVSGAKYSEVGEILQATKRKDQAKTEFLTGRNLE